MDQFYSIYLSCVAIVLIVSCIVNLVIKLGYGDRKVPAWLMGLFVGAIATLFITAVMACFIILNRP